MKILMVVSDFYDTGHGGVEGHVLGVGRSLMLEGHEVVVLRIADRPIIHPEYDPLADGIDYRILRTASGTSRAWAKRFRAGGRLGLFLEFARRVYAGYRSRGSYREVLELVGDVDVVHQHNFLEGIGLSREFAAAGKRVVWTNHLGEFLYLRRIPLFGPFALRRLTRHYSAAAAPSAELADAKVISAPVSQIPNGVDIKRFRPVSGDAELASIREQLGWPTNKRVVIVPRRWAPTKGVVFAARAMSLPQWPVGTHVVFAGSGTEEYPGYSEEITRALRSSRVTYDVHASIDQGLMAEMLRAADVCLIPSVKEATSLSALEAMASGVPVVAARVGGLPEIIEQGRTGFLHEPGDPSSVADSVALALDHDNLSEAARSFVCDGNSWEAIARRTAVMYEGAP